MIFTSIRLKYYLKFEGLSMITKSDIYCIAYGCPKKKRDNDYPLLEIDHLSFKEKIEFIDKLSEEKKGIILSHHIFCTKD